MKKFILAFTGLIVLFHIIWYTGSKIYQNRGLPDPVKVKAYEKGYFRDADIKVDLTKMEDSYLNSHGFTLHLSVFSHSKKSPTIVFIPGTSIYAQLYIELLYGLYRKGFNIVGFDPRGHGMSTGKRGDYTVNELVDDTLEVISFARKKFSGKIILMGSSQGGITALYTVARQDDLDAVVCHSVAELNGRDNISLSELVIPPMVTSFALGFCSLYKSYSIPVTLYIDLTKEHVKDGTDIPTHIKIDPQVAGYVTLRALGSIIKTDLAKPLEKIKTPIMVIHGENDSIFPIKYTRGIYDRLTCKKKYLLIKNADHQVMTNNADKVIPPIVSWLRGTIR